MAKSKDHDDDPKREPKDKYEPGRKHEGGRRPHPGYEREETGDDPARHASIIERRWQGSPAPTAERYAKALQQWQKLPGAVSRPATDVTPPDEKPANTNPTGEESKS
jgi:hypothetical protein